MAASSACSTRHIRVYIKAQTVVYILHIYTIIQFYYNCIFFSCLQMEMLDDYPIDSHILEVIKNDGKHQAALSSKAVALRKYIKYAKIN